MRVRASARGGGHTHLRAILHPRNLRHVGGVLACVALVLVLTPGGIADRLPPSPVATATPVISDGFARTVSNGWANATIGGQWQVSAPTSAWSVASGLGSILLSSRGAAYTATLPTSLRDMDATLTTTITSPPTGWGTMVYALGRRNGLDDYRSRIRVAPDGTIYAAIIARVANADRMIGNEVPIPRVRWTASTRIALRFRVTGAAPTALNLRVWNAATTEPTTWDISAIDGDALLQRAGVFGTMAYASTTSTTLPLTVRIASVQVISSPPLTVTYGGVALGTTAYPAPPDALYVSNTGNDANPGTITAPLQTLGQAVAVAPSGATIVMRGGIYRESVTWFGKKLTIQPAPNETVWMRGSQVVTGWVADGTTWRRDNWTVGYDRAVDPDLIDPAYPNAGLPDEVFVDGTELTQVGSKAAVTAGTFYFDVAGQHLYIGTNPTGHSVEVSTLARAIYINHGDGSVVRGIGFEYYATSDANISALFSVGDDVAFENDTFQQNAAAGLAVTGDGVSVSNSRFFSNGQLGLLGNLLTNSVLRGNWIEANNFEHFKITGASGGLKLTAVTNVQVIANLSDKNITRGMWVDIGSGNVTIARNIVRDNGDRGIQYEISTGGKIIGNTILRNAAGGVSVIESTNVEIYNNTFDHNLRGIDVIDGTRPQLVSGVTIRNNLISGTETTTNNLLNVNDTTNLRSAEAMGVSANYDAYSRESATFPKYLVTWASFPPPIRVFTSVADFKARTGQEAYGTGLDGTTNPWYVNPAVGDFRIAPGSTVLGRAVALPSDVAAVLGVATGAVLDPGAP